jgi:NADPH-dependent 2,4-dienoyl-CoA reductase/sulfur reductase-like enzyme/rhodanese-related sulfurtransferase
MRIIIIGAVAAGTSVAAKARRNSESAEIIVYEKDVDISYSGCGMPYAIGNQVEDTELTPRDPHYFKQKYNIDIHIQHEVLSIDPQSKTLLVKNLMTNKTFTDYYDQLVISTGATSFVPPIQGRDLPHVFTLRTIQDMHRIKAHINTHEVNTVAIIGSGFIGLELVENLHVLGKTIHIIEKLPQLSPTLDEDVSWYVEDYIRSKGVNLHLSSSVDRIDEKTITINQHEVIKADMVIVATGVRPNVGLAKNAGIQLGITGAIAVNEYMETNLKDVYACGDCVEYNHLITNQPVYRPMGSTANKTGRVVADNLFGIKTAFKGVLGTAIYQLFDLHVGQTGLTERDAIQAGFDILPIFNIKPNKPDYMGGEELTIKVIAEKNTERILGAQVIGHEGVDKRLDVFATAITFKAKATDLIDLDLAYAPPFSTTKDPIMYSGMIIHNALNRGRSLMTAQEVLDLIHSNQPHTIIDTRVPKQYEKGHVPGAINIPHEVFRDQIQTLDKNKLTITYCNKGVTGNATQNILLNEGFTQVYSISGGYRTFKQRYDHTKQLKGIK